MIFIKMMTMGIMMMITMTSMKTTTTKSTKKKTVLFYSHFDMLSVFVSAGFSL